MGDHVDRAAEGVPRVLCDHRCLLPDGHDGLHQHGYHLPAAPVDGDLRDALVEAVLATLQSAQWPDGERKIKLAPSLLAPIVNEAADVLLPVIAAHVAEQVRSAKADAWDEGWTASTDHAAVSWTDDPHNPYREEQK